MNISARRVGAWGGLRGVSLVGPVWVKSITIWGSFQLSTSGCSLGQSITASCWKGSMMSHFVLAIGTASYKVIGQPCATSGKLIELTYGLCNADLRLASCWQEKYSGGTGFNNRHPPTCGGPSSSCPSLSLLSLSTREGPPGLSVHLTPAGQQKQIAIGTIQREREKKKVSSCWPAVSG